MCRPAQGHEAFTAPATPAEIAAALVITESAVKQHLLRLYAKPRIPEGTNRRLHLASTTICAGLAAKAAARPYLAPPPGNDTGAAPAQARGAAAQPGRKN